MTGQVGARDEGSATVVGAFVVMALVVIAALVIGVGGAVASRHRAQSAADLAALAGAYAVDQGTEAGCAAATASAMRMRARVQECRVDGWDVQVRVSVRTELARLGVRDAVASARAGPAEDGGNGEGSDP